MNLNIKIEQLNKVGKVTTSRLKRLGINNARDLLFYFPFRYEDYRTIKNIGDLQEGEMITVRGKIELINSKRSFKKKKIIIEALVSDESGSIRVVWFGQPYIKKTLKIGDTVFLSGKVTEDMIGTQLVSPTYEKDIGKQTSHTARLVPMYPLTANLTQKQIRFLVTQIIDLVDSIEDWIPEEILENQDLILLSQALRGIHFPVDENDLKQSTDRLKFDELFLLQLKAELSRREKTLQKSPVFKFKEPEIKDFVKNLPFNLTKTQKISAWDILQDLEKNHPMNRLLSGDVGCGKTVVAGVAMYNVILNGYQSAIMAPTEILATQHYQTLLNLFGNKLNVGLLTSSQFVIPNSSQSEESLRGQISEGSLLAGRDDKIIIPKTTQRKELFDKLSNGEIDIVVGTHALLSEKVKFKKLGLVIVDEQHRFGVQQRKQIKEKGKGINFLSMTATPIPRSLALMVYGDLDVSIINELPPGRKPVLTRLVEPINRNKAYEFIRKQVNNNKQVFVVCPLIEEQQEIVIPTELARVEESLSSLTKGSLTLRRVRDDSTSDKKSVMNEHKKLSEKIFPNLKVGYLHGKLKSAEKEKTMNDFKNKKIDILVSTSVIEVGVDIPDATVMMIEGAERFGLAQLHQFRGRVGRSSYQSYCFLFIDNESPRALERLKFFEKNNDGFKLADKDLEMRGPGEVYGTTQSGMMNLRLAKLTDRDIIKKARASARGVVNNLSKYPKLINKIKEWESGVHLE